MTDPAAQVATVHIYRNPSQSAIRFVDCVGGSRHVHRNPPHRLLWTNCCRKRRPAKNLTVQVYYDMLAFYCRPKRGCKKEKP